MKLRAPVQTVVGQDTSDGAGVRLRRSIGTPSLDHLDPFLLLDEFRSDNSDDYIAGFPDHPHRGFETVTYMLAGRMEHRDHTGVQGNLEAGSIQWMTAGRGIIHSEMPKQEEGLMWGFQLWINLPADQKMTQPRYQDIPPGNIPEVVRDNARIRVLAGEVQGQRGPIEGIVTNPTYLDVSLEPHSQFTPPAAPWTHGIGLRVRRQRLHRTIGTQRRTAPAQPSGGSRRRRGCRGSNRRGLNAFHPACGQTHRRTDRPIWALRHEHARGTEASLQGNAGWDVSGKPWDLG